MSLELSKLHTWFAINKLSYPFMALLQQHCSLFHVLSGTYHFVCVSLCSNLEGRDKISSLFVRGLVCVQCGAAVFRLAIIFSPMHIVRTFVIHSYKGLAF